MGLLTRWVPDADEQRVESKAISHPERLAMAVLSAADANDAVPSKPATVTNESRKALLKIEQPLFEVDSGLVSREYTSTT